MKTSIKLILFIGILFLISCETNNPPYYKLKGKWVESVQRKDTLLFNYLDSVGGSFWLNNGLELRNGHMLPKASAGLYDFKFRNDSILLYYGLSSTYNFKPYYYKLNATFDVLQIGNFYNSGIPNTARMTFVRIN